MIERPPSIRPPPAQQLIAGTALGGTGALGEYVFEVIGARKLSLDIAFPDGSAPVDGVVFDEVLLRVGTRLDVVQLGRCRYEASPEHGGRIVPIHTPINCRELLGHGRLVDFDHAFTQIPLLLARKRDIAPEFQQYTADLVYDMRIYRSLLDDVDAALVYESQETREEMERWTIKEQGRGFMRLLDERLDALEKLVRSFTRQEHERHGFYFRRHVWDAIMIAPFFLRTNLKPRGYSGDSVTMQYAYENAYRGDTLFGKLLHKHPLESAAAQAVRNRRRLVVEAITRERREAAPGERLRLLSVACGPACEVGDLLRTAEDFDAYEIVLLDQDEEALGDAVHHIAKAERRAGRTAPLHYVRESVRTLLRNDQLSDSLGHYDIVYSMGLFDYLTEPVARAVLRKLYALLAPGGQALVGNFHPRNPTRWYMEYWMDWSLLYRTEEELSALARDLPGASTTIMSDETGSHMFLSVRREAA
jgi:extracellular factor (EF) 3-hydroxypalmitic acid methyl ester biosynthesis protein